MQENEDSRLKNLSEEERTMLEAQNSRIVSEFQAQKLEKECKKNWDLFYKRNETKFFKDRNWTTREFEELLNWDLEEPKVMLEVGCGVGNLVFPLLENPKINMFFFCCDFSPRAVDFVKQNPLYDNQKMKVFQCDITESSNFADHIENASLDLVTMVFVLSAISPEKFGAVVKNLGALLKPGGMVLFRDYGRYDMAQLRFKAGTKIADNLYVRQDGTRSYFFTTEETSQLFEDNGFRIQSNQYITNRRTINAKENIDVPRIFLQGKYIKR